MRRCPHCSEDHPTAGECIRVALENGLALPVGFRDFIFGEAARLVANEDATLEDIEAALDAWNSGTKPTGIKKLQMFQARHWPEVARVCLGRNTDTPTEGGEFFTGEA